MHQGGLRALCSHIILGPRLYLMMAGIHKDVQNIAHSHLDYPDSTDQIKGGYIDVLPPLLKHLANVSFF